MLNQYKIVGDVLVVYNRKDGREMLFDAEDFDLVSKYTWRIRAYTKNLEYARSSKGNAHRYIMNNPIGMMIDHKNGNGLDNRKLNLRIVTGQINQHNRHASRGYYWNKQAKKWKSQIRANNTTIFLGYYKTEDEARAAYLQAKKIYHPSAPHHLYK